MNLIGKFFCGWFTGLAQLLSLEQQKRNNILEWKLISTAHSVYYLCTTEWKKIIW